LKNTQSAGALVLACACFLGLGILTAGIGPALSELAENTASPLSAAGGIFTGLFFGSLAAQFLIGRLLDRLGPRWLLLGGLLVTGSGMIFVSTSQSLSLMLAFAVLTGLGHGTLNLATNVSISNLFPQKRASALNLINLFYGIGAFIAPAVAGLALRLWNSSLPALWLGAGIELLLLPMFLGYFHIPAAAPQKNASGANHQLLLTPVLWLFSFFLLIYVGAENGVGGWVTTYLTQTTSLAAATAALVASVFWLALTLGRLAGTLLGTRWPARTLVYASLATSLAGGLLIVVSLGNTPLSILGFLLLGFGYGPVYPTTLAILTDTFREAPGAATSLAVAMGSIGGMLIPWLQGVVLESFGPRSGALLFPLTALLMLAGLTTVRRASRQPGNHTISNGAG
jgi:fucose permease